MAEFEAQERANEERRSNLAQRLDVTAMPRLAGTSTSSSSTGAREPPVPSRQEILDSGQP